MSRWVCWATLVALAGCSDTAPQAGTDPQPVPPVVAPPVLAPPIAPPPVVSAPNKPEGWVAFTEDTKAFTMNTPGLAYANPMNSLPSSPGFSMPQTYNGTGHGLNFYLSYFERDAAEVPAVRAAVYERGGSGGLQTFGETKARRDVTWGGHPAVEFEVQTPTTTTIFRGLNVGNRFYSAWIAGQEGHPTAAEREAFFGSFVLKTGL